MESIFNEKIVRSNTILYCEHWNKTIKFYRDILKLSIAHETDWLVEFQLLDHAYLSIADAHRATIQSAKGIGLTLSFKVEDVDRAHGLLCGLGIKVSEIKSIWGERAFYLHDPEGHRIELWT